MVTPSTIGSLRASTCTASLKTMPLALNSEMRSALSNRLHDGVDGIRLRVYTWQRKKRFVRRWWFGRVGLEGRRETIVPRAHLYAARGDATVDATIAAAAVATAAGARRRSSGAFAFFGAPSVLDAIATMGAGRVRRCAGPARRDRTTD
jgi:hypothetical protein